MQRKRLTTVLTGLGLAAACTPAAAGITPEPASDPSLGVEPSGRGLAAKPITPASAPPHEPHFTGVPTVWCKAKLQASDRALLRTSSFLEVWNELAPKVRNRLAHNIPSSEIDARVYVCGSAQCTVDEARLAQVTADYMIGVGVLIPEQGELLVVPGVANAHTAGPCATDAAVEVARHGSFIHVHAVSHDRQYQYSYGHGPDYGYGSERALVGCETYSTAWRDLVIDASTGELELIVDQAHAGTVTEPPVALSFEEPGIVLYGCGSAIELQWTQ